MAIRINKYLSEVGYCSRRGADKLIEEGKVTINNKIAEIGAKIDEADYVEVEGQRIVNLKKQKKPKMYKVLPSKSHVYLLPIKRNTRKKNSKH